MALVVSTGSANTMHLVLPCLDCGRLTLCDQVVCPGTDERRMGYCDCGGIAIEGATA